MSAGTRFEYTYSDLLEPVSRKLCKNQGFLQKCWNFDFAVSFWFLIRFLCFFMFFKVQNWEFRFSASDYSKNLLQWTKKSWLSAVSDKIFENRVFETHFLKISFFKKMSPFLPVFMKFLKVQNRETVSFASMLNLLQYQRNDIYFISKPLQTHQLFERADLWLFHVNAVSPRQTRGSRGAGRCASAGFRSCSETRSMTPPPLTKSYYRIYSGATGNCNLL